MSLIDYRQWLNRLLDLTGDTSLSLNEVLIRFDLLEEPNILPDRLVDTVYHDDPDLKREKRRKRHGGGGGSGNSSSDAMVGVVMRAKEADREALRGGGSNTTIMPYSSRYKEVEGLVLEHVHGYYCATKRHTISYIKSGEVVYPAATIAVVGQVIADETSDLSDLNDSSSAFIVASSSKKGSGGTTSHQRYYRHHGGTIISVAVHPDGVIVATGEGPTTTTTTTSTTTITTPEIHVWNSDTLKTLVVLKGLHGSSSGIHHLAFSPTGRLLASLGISGNGSSLLVVYEWAKGSTKGLRKIAQCSMFAFDMW